MTPREMTAIRKKLEERNIKIKAPMTSFFLFLNAKRDLMLKEFPGMTSVQLAKLMGMVWQKFNE